MPLITCRKLGGIGRFGNMLALYCFVRGYAERYGFELHTSNWIGRKIFANVNEPLVTEATAHFPQTRIDSHTREPFDRYFGRSEIDIRVYAQHQIYLDGFQTRNKIREWLTIKPEFEAFAPAPCHKPYSAAHIRKGDYVDHASFNHSYCEVSEQSYEDAIEDFKIPRPVLKVFEGWRKEPTNVPPELSWLPDFLLLRDAAYLLRANSTFSYFAGVLGHGKVYSPLVETRVGLWDVRFCEGNHANTAGRFANQSDLILKE